VEDEYCVKHRRLLGINHESVPTNNRFSSAMSSQSGQSSSDSYDSSSDDEEIRSNLAEMTPARRDLAAHLITA
jgi:hypothetical protein